MTIATSLVRSIIIALLAGALAAPAVAAQPWSPVDHGGAATCADGSVTNICVNDDYDSNYSGNKLAEYRYLRLTIPATDQYDVLIQTTTTTPPTADPNDRDQSDPDMYIWRDGQFITRGISGAENIETFTTPTLLAGVTYVADLQEFRYEDDDPVNGTPDTYPSQICFDVSFTATP